MKVKFDLYLYGAPSGISFMLDPDKTPLYWHQPYKKENYSAVCYLKSTLNFLNESQLEKVIHHTTHAGYTSSLVSKCGTILIDLNSEYNTKKLPLEKAPLSPADLYVEEFLKSKSNNYVVFNSNAEILYEGDLLHCVAWVNEHNEYYPIYAKEAYDKMKETIK